MDKLIEEAEKWLDSGSENVYEAEDTIRALVDRLKAADEVVSLARVTHFNATESKDGNYIVSKKVMERLEQKLVVFSQIQWRR